MECVICGRKYDPGLTGYRYCAGCGAKLVDCGRRELLTAKLAELEAARLETEREMSRSPGSRDALATVAGTLAREAGDVRTELEALEEERRRALAGWVDYRMKKVSELLGRGMDAEAQDAVEAVIRVEPRAAAAHVAMARILLHRGRLEEAIRAARYARDLEPGDAPASDFLGYLESVYRDRQEAGGRSPEGPPPSGGEVHAGGRCPRPQDGHGGLSGGGGRAANGHAPVPPGPPVLNAGRREAQRGAGSSAAGRRRRPDFARWLRTLVERGVLKWWYFVGTFILMAGVTGLVTWQWSRVGRYFVFCLAVGITAGLYALGHFLRRRIRLGSMIIMAIASLMVPLSIFLFGYYRIGGGQLDAEILGIAGSIVAMVIYGVNFFYSRDEAMCAFTALTPVSLVFFVLRGSEVSVQHFGLVFVGLAFLYFGLGYLLRRGGSGTYSMVIYGVANATVVFALLTTAGDVKWFFGESLRSSGVLIGAAAAALLVGSYVYEDRVLAFASSGLVVLSACFLGLRPGEGWFSVAPVVAAAAGVLLLVGYLDYGLLERREGKPFIWTGVAAVTLALGAVAAKDILLNLPDAWKAASAAEVRSSIVTAAIAAALLWVYAAVERNRRAAFIASSAAVYASIVLFGSLFESLAVLCMLEVTVVAGALMVIGLVLDSAADREWALTAWIPAFCVAAAGTVGALVLYLPVISRRMLPGVPLYGNAYASLTVSAAAATVYFIAGAFKTRRPEWIYGACVTGAMAYAVQVHAASGWGWVRDLSGGGINYGLLFVPLVLALVVAGYVLERSGREEMAVPLFVGCAGAASFSFVSQFYYMYTGWTPAVALTFGVLMVICFAGAVVRDRGEFLYPGLLCAFMLARQVVGLSLPGGGAGANFPLYMSPVAAVALVAGAALAVRGGKDRHAVPMLVSAVSFLAIGAVYQGWYVYRGFGWSVCWYAFGWAAVCMAAAAIAGRSGEEGWKRLLPEVAAPVSIVHLAAGAGYAAYLAAGSQAAASGSLALLGAAMVAAYAAARRFVPEWLEHVLRFGAPVVSLAAVIVSLVEPSWRTYNASVAGSFVLALSIAAAGLAGDESFYRRIAVAAYAAVSGISFLLTVGAAGWPMSRGAIAWQCVSLAAVAALAFLSSERDRDAFVRAAACLLAALAWLCGGELAGVLKEYAGYWLAVPAVVLAACAYLHHAFAIEDLATVEWLAAGAAFATAIAVPMAHGMEMQAIVVIGTAMAIGCVLVPTYGDERLAYIPLGLSVLETVYVAAVLRPALSATMAGLIITGPAVAYLACGWLLSGTRPRLSDMLLQFCAGMTAAGTVVAIYGLLAGGGSDIYLAMQLFAAAALYAGIAVTKGYPWMAHVSFVHFAFGYVTVLADRSISSPHLYLLPMGLYLIATGYYLEWAGRGRREVRVLHVAGFTTLALSSLIPAIREESGLHAMVLLTESLAALAVGIVQRRTVFVGCGLVFIVVDGLVMLWSPVASLHWSVYAVLVGAAIIVVGILFETRREAILEKGSLLVRQLSLWK